MKTYGVQNTVFAKPADYWDETTRAQINYNLLGQQMFNEAFGTSINEVSIDVQASFSDDEEQGIVAIWNDLFRGVDMTNNATAFSPDRLNRANAGSGNFDVV